MEKDIDKLEKIINVSQKGYDKVFLVAFEKM